MSGVEKAPHKIGFRRRQLKSCTGRFVAIVGFSFALLAPSLRAEFLYVTNVNGQSISAYHNDENGALRPLAGSPFPAAGNPAAVAVDHLGRFAYVANLIGNSVSAYRIAENGALKPIGSPVPAGNEPVSPAVDFLSPFLYVANVADGTVSAYSIGPNGALTPVAGSPFPGQGTLASSLAVDPFSRSVYVTNSIANSSSETVSAYSINPTTGALTPVAGSPFPGGIYVAVDLLGRFVYVVNGGNIILAYRIGKNGALTPVKGSPFPDSNDPFSVTVDPLGRFAYVVNTAIGGTTIASVSAYRIEANGALTPVKGSPFPTGGISPLLAAVDHLGRFAYVTNFVSNNVSAFRIDPNGALTPVKGSPFPAGFGPRGVAVSP